MRRIYSICDELNNWASVNSTGDHCFRASSCGKEVATKLEVQFSIEDDYIPLLRDAFGRMTPPGGILSLRHCGHWSYDGELSYPEVEIPSRSRHPKLWNKLISAQKIAVEEIEGNNLSGYRNDEMGTGKTVVSLTILRENWEEMTPCLIITEAGDIHRWQKEGAKWLGASDFQDDLVSYLEHVPQILDKKSIDGSLGQVVITSWTNVSDPAFQKMLFDRGFKSVISDEAHMFKNEDSTRTQGFVKLCQSIPHRIFLSGTWIENRIAEAFIPLNILDPKFFPSRGVLYGFCLMDSNGNAYSLREESREFFFRRISKYVFRMTKEKSGIKLPKLFSYSEGNRDPIWIDPQRFKSNLGFIDEYNKGLNELEEELNSFSPSYGQVIGLMSQLRHITGKMKVMSAVEHLVLWLTEKNEKEKICIGVHHKSVMNWIKTLLEKLGYPVLTMSDEPAMEKDRIEALWKKSPDHRILIASILGAGKGRNLQFCQNFIVLERQWNPSKERQFEQRFHRILVDENDNIRTEFRPEDDVYGDYLMATNSFDEYFDKMIALKTEIVDSADLASREDPPPPREFIMELAREMIKTRMKYVGV